MSRLLSRSTSTIIPSTNRIIAFRRPSQPDDIPTRNTESRIRSVAQREQAAEVEMASLVNTMCVSQSHPSCHPYPQIHLSAMSTLSAATRGLTPSESTQTIKAHHHYLPIEPPSYLSTAVRALKGSIPILTPPSNARTKGPFKPRSSRGTTSYQLRKFAEETLGSGSLRKAVKLPEGEDVNEWLAVNGTSYSFTR